MPSPEVVRDDQPNCYYHVYSRGVNKQVVFCDDQDKEAFLYFIDRYLSFIPLKNPSGGSYATFCEDISVLSYAIMDNHFHMLTRQRNRGELSRFMTHLLLAYSAHAHKKHSFIGPLFQSRYKAKIITSEPYWLYISKYIHRNPKDYENYAFSSYQSYVANKSRGPSWLETNDVLSAFSSTKEYEYFVRS